VKQLVYIDTSVIGGVFDDEFKEWSVQLINEFKQGTKTALISDLTLKELEEAPENVRTMLDEIPDENKEFVLISDEERELANEYLKENVVTEKYLIDARHIAIATVRKMDVLVSWNFHHIVNLNRIKQYNAVNLKLGYNIIEIRTPREVISDD